MRDRERGTEYSSMGIASWLVDILSIVATEKPISGNKHDKWTLEDSERVQRRFSQAISHRMFPAVYNKRKELLVVTLCEWEISQLELDGSSDDARISSQRIQN